jgi:hypothetical protein
MTDRDAPRPTASAEWNADFRAAEDQTLEASLAATPSQRLAWLEEALAFAWKVGALPRSDEETVVRNGVPLLPQRPKESQRPDMEQINRLRDET